MIDRQNLFDQPAENNWKTYDNIRKDCNWSTRWLHNWLFSGL